MAIAAEVLAVAPDHREAKAIRGKAWVVASPETADFIPMEGVGARPKSTAAELNKREVHWESVRPPQSLVANAVVRDALRSGGSSGQLSSSSGGGGSLPKRFLLWVDGVGGYLVCLSSRVTFGQATADGPVDVPLFAEVSRTHAEVTRDGEGYVIESGRGIRVNGEETKLRGTRGGRSRHARGKLPVPVPQAGCGEFVRAAGV